MAMYKSKPVKKEAEIFKRERYEKLKAFAGRALSPMTIERKPGGKATCKINTLEGAFEVAEGDYIIKGLNGEFYSCKPDIFKKTYEIID